MRLDLIFTIRDIYINYNLDPLRKFRTSSWKRLVQQYPPIEHLSNDHEDRPNQNENSHNHVIVIVMCGEKEHPLLSLKEN